MFRKPLLFVLFASIPVVACTPASDAIEDDLAAESGSGLGEESKADTNGTYTYFEITRDFRKCVSPLCGGFWVSRVNHELTKCANNLYAETCYVAELDLATAGLPEGHGFLGAIEAGKALVRGKIERKRFPNFGNLGRFVASEAWVAGAGAGSPDGVFVKVEPTDIRCFAQPCADKVEFKLNSTLWARIADLDFGPSGANADEISKANEALANGDLIVAGHRYFVTGPGGTAKARTVTQFYIRFQETAVPGLIEAEDTTQVTRSANWALFLGGVLHNGEGLEASAAGATLTFSMIGTALTVFHEVGPNRNEFTITVDGVLTSSVNTNAPEFAFQVPSVVASGLSSGTHTVVLECVSTICAIDYFLASGN